MVKHSQSSPETQYAQTTMSHRLIEPVQSFCFAMKSAVCGATFKLINPPASVHQDVFRRASP
jgi:hypothetical protein